jgi:hypothetical protein
VAAVVEIMETHKEQLVIQVVQVAAVVLVKALVNSLALVVQELHLQFKVLMAVAALPILQALAGQVVVVALELLVGMPMELNLEMVVMV